MDILAHIWFRNGRTYGFFSLSLSESASLPFCSGGGKLNKIDRPNTTPTVCAICKFAVYFSVFQPFCRFTLVYEGYFVLL